MGKGKITVAGKDADLKDENRDVSKASKKIFDVTDEGAKSDLTLDTRFLTIEGRTSISHDLQNTNKLIMKAMPNYALTATQLAAFATLDPLAIFHSIASQVPIVLGQADDRAISIQLTTDPENKKFKQKKDGDNSKDDDNIEFQRMEDSEIYKNMSKDKQDELLIYQKEVGKQIYIATVEITKGSKTYQNVVNGMLSNKGDSVVSALNQTYKKDGKIMQTKELEVSMAYNPTHGLVGDLLESSVGMLGFETGIDKQVGGYMGETTKARQGMGKQTVFTAHSQGNIQLRNGLNILF